MHTVLWKNRPRLRFIDTPTPATGTPGADGTSTTPLTGPDGLPLQDPQGDPDPKDGDPEPKGDKGFPANTPVAEMTPEQSAAYWKFQSRKHEKAATAAQKLVDDAAEAAKTDEQKREDRLRREGEALGAQPFIKRAVRGELRAATGLAPAEVDELLEFADPNTFLTDGDVDDAKIAKFAARVKAGDGVTPPPASGPPASVLAGLGGAAAPRSGTTAPQGSSLADKKKAAKERLENSRPARRRA